MKKSAQKPPTPPLPPGVPPPPGHLSDEAKGIWAMILGDFDLEPAACLILASGLEAFDRMRDAQAIIAAEGQTYRDRWQQPRQHPACLNERDARNAFQRAIKSLNIDLEPIRDKPGRPPGR